MFSVTQQAENRRKYEACEALRKPGQYHKFTMTPMPDSGGDQKYLCLFCGEVRIASNHTWAREHSLVHDLHVCQDKLLEATGGKVPVSRMKSAAPLVPDASEANVFVPLPKVILFAF
jgi:hypothetical protein